MNRRQVLSLGAATGIASLGGCLGIGEPVPLSHAEPTQSEDEATLTFTDDKGRAVARFTLEYDRLSATRWDLELHAWHDEATRLARFRYEIHAPTVGQQPAVSVSLVQPGGGPWPDLTFDGSATDTVIAADELGELGEGSLSLEITLQSTARVPRLPVRVFCDYQLTRDGVLSSNYTAGGSLQMDLPGQRPPF